MSIQIKVISVSEGKKYTALRLEKDLLWIKNPPVTFRGDSRL
jgi:hypothetical protein